MQLHSPLIAQGLAYRAGQRGTGERQTLNECSVLAESRSSWFAGKLIKSASCITASFSSTVTLKKSGLQKVYSSLGEMASSALRINCTTRKEFSE